MKSIGLLILIALSLVASPLLAGESYVVHSSFASSNNKSDNSNITKQNDTQQYDKASKIAHCCFGHQVSARLDKNYEPPAPVVGNIKFVFSDCVGCSFNEPPPLAPPKHV